MSERKPYTYVWSHYNDATGDIKFIVRPLSDEEAVEATLGGLVVLWLNPNSIEPFDGSGSGNSLYRLEKPA